MAEQAENIPMKLCISAEEPLAQTIERILREEGIAKPAETASCVGIRVAASVERRECTADTIWSNGWISCTLARAIARKLGIPGRSMGALLFALDVKIRQCELGCFK